MTVHIPYWLMRMLMGKQMAEVDSRSAVTGRASTTNRRDLGIVEVETQVSVERR